MTDNIQVALGCAAQGLKDSIIGIFKLYNLDKDVGEEKATQQDEPMSVLARRRAERSKGKETTKPKSEQKVIPRIILCCAWNGGVFAASILLFYSALLPGLKLLTNVLFGDASAPSSAWSWVGPMLSWTFSALWVLPLFVISKIINSLWFQDIADAAYRKSRGRPQMFPSISKIIADILFSLLLQALFLIQGMLASLMPIAAIGYVISQLHMCLLYSLYAFEYKWFNMGWEVHKRLSHIESNWPYFVGFGLPLTLLTSWPSSLIISGCVFSILFPLFIISANEAMPMPRPFPFPLRLFAPVVSVTDSIFHHSVKKSQPPTTAGQPSPVKQVKVQEAPPRR